MLLKYFPFLDAVGVIAIRRQIVFFHDAIDIYMFKLMSFIRLYLPFD